MNHLHHITSWLLFLMSNIKAYNSPVVQKLSTTFKAYPHKTASFHKIAHLHKIAYSYKKAYSHIKADPHKTAYPHKTVYSHRIAYFSYQIVTTHITNSTVSLLLNQPNDAIPRSIPPRSERWRSISSFESCQLHARKKKSSCDQQLRRSPMSRQTSWP